MADQETELIREDDGTVSRLATLHLHGCSHHLPTGAADAAVDADASPQEKCTICCPRNKRHSPTFFQEPSLKKPVVHRPPTTTSAAENFLCNRGFIKVLSPQLFPNVCPPLLSRPVSEPIFSPGETINSHVLPAKSPGHSPAAGQDLTAHLPEINDPLETHVSQLVPQPLYRTASDPTPAVNHQLPENFKMNNPQETSPCQLISRPLHRTSSDPSPIANRTPSRPPLARKSSQSPTPREGSSELKTRESPSAKRLKRMKERMAQMNQWWNQIVQEDETQEEEEEQEQEAEEKCYETDINQKFIKDESMSEDGEKSEAVWVDKVGSCPLLHIKCPCGYGYQILINGQDCYYKLTNC